MQYPPIKTIEAVLQGRLDYRAKRDVTHYRHFFRAFDAKGNPTTDEQEVETVQLTQRGRDYYNQMRPQAAVAST